MNRHHALALLFCLLLFIVAGCEQTSIAEQEQIRNLATLVGSTPSVTPTPTTTSTPTATPSPTATTGPSPTPTATLPPTETPPPSPTPLPPTATPNPALANFSLCDQVAGDAAGGRFSARIMTITTTVDPAFERISIALEAPENSAPPYASASCVSAADDEALTGAPGSGSAYLLQLNLDGWLHDDAFRASPISQTQALSGTTVLKNIAFRFDPNADAGATLLMELEEPLPFRLTLERNPYRLVLDVAKTSPIGPSSDFLAVEAGAGAQPDTPLFYIQDGDIWTFADGQATNVTDSPEIETALTVSNASSQIAFCRIAPGADIGDALAPSALWVADLDGGNERLLAAPGSACAEPVFSPDGSQIAFAVDETGASPTRSSIWLTSVDGETGEQRLTSPNDEWSRFGPQWVGNDQLVYAATAEDGRSTLFLRTANDQEQDIGADLVRGDRYSALGRPTTSPAGDRIAVEGWRSNGSGADIVLLDASGAEVSLIGGGYWSRPLAWNEDGSLYYLTTICASGVVQDYELHLRSANDNDRLIAAGKTLGGFGSFRATGAGLAYVTLEHGAPGARGPLALDQASASGLWFWDVAGGPRSKLVEAPSLITDIAP